MVLGTCLQHMSNYHIKIILISEKYNFKFSICSPLPTFLMRYQRPTTPHSAMTSRSFLSNFQLTTSANCYVQIETWAGLSI